MITITIRNPGIRSTAKPLIIRARTTGDSVKPADTFRKTPAYAAAVEQGLIMDDDWVADYVEQPAASRPANKTIHIHIK